MQWLTTPKEEDVKDGEIGCVILVCMKDQTQGRKKKSSKRFHTTSTKDATSHNSNTRVGPLTRGFVSCVGMRVHSKNWNNRSLGKAQGGKVAISIDVTLCYGRFSRNWKEGSRQCLELNAGLIRGRTPQKYESNGNLGMNQIASIVLKYISYIA